jgi:hypothetical protein
MRMVGAEADSDMIPVLAKLIVRFWRFSMHTAARRA